MKCQVNQSTRIDNMTASRKNYNERNPYENIFMKDVNMFGKN